MLLIASGFVGQPRPAAAEPTVADKERARALLLDGREKLKAGSALEALKLFQAAHAIMGVPTTGLDVARALEALGRLIEAHAMAREVTRIPAQPNEPNAFKNARAAAAELAEKLAARLPALVIEVKGPLVARVTVDGAAVPAQALGVPWKVDPGEHTIVAAAEGFGSERREVTVNEGETAPVEITLVPRRAGADGAPAESVAGGPDAASESERAEGAAVPAWAWASGAAGLVALGVGTVFVIDYVSVRNTAAEDCPDEVCDPDQYDEGEAADLRARWNRDIGLAIGLGAVGLAGVGVAIYGIVTAPGAARSDARAAGRHGVVVSPWIGGGAGAMVRGSF